MMYRGCNDYGLRLVGSLFERTWASTMGCGFVEKERGFVQRKLASSGSFHLALDRVIETEVKELVLKKSMMGEY